MFQSFSYPSNLETLKLSRIERRWEFMKCEWVQQNIVLYVYDELPDDARYELEQHISRCKDCATELETIKKFRTELSRSPIQEPNPGFLAASRMRLQEA